MLICLKIYLFNTSNHWLEARIKIRTRTCVQSTSTRKN